IIPTVALGRDERFKKRKQRKKGKFHMKGTLITVACVALASLAFGQARTDSNTNAGPTATVSNSMTGHLGVGTVEGFNPADKYITVVTSANTQPVKYVLGGAIRYENPSGAAISPSTVRQGARVSLEFDNNGQVNRVIVVDAT